MGHHSILENVKFSVGKDVANCGPLFAHHRRKDERSGLAQLLRNKIQTILTLCDKKKKKVRVKINGEKKKTTLPLPGAPFRFNLCQMQPLSENN